MNKQALRCPVCAGSAGFYDWADSTTVGTMPGSCLSCNKHGYIAVDMPWPDTLPENAGTTSLLVNSHTRYVVSLGAYS